MQSIGEILQDQNIILDTIDPISLHGFTQIPNFILKNAKLSMGARIAYAVLLSYAWNNNCVFPGQETMSSDMGVDERTLRRYLDELKKSGLVEVTQRGLGKTNLYKLKFRVTKIETFVDKPGPDRTDLSGQDRMCLSGHSI